LALIGLHLFDTWEAKKVETRKAFASRKSKYVCSTLNISQTQIRILLERNLHPIIGRMAIVPRQSEEGDLPCHLKTALVPFMLWKKHNQRHALVGSCYFMALRMRHKEL